MSVEIDKSGPVVKVILRDNLTDADLAVIAEAGLEVDAISPVAPDRLTDFTKVTSIALNFMEMEMFVSRRRASTLNHSVRSAIVAPTQLQYGFARMFQTLNDNPRIEIRLFRDMASARDWLASPRTDALAIESVSN